MSNEPRKPNVEKLELNRETVADLTEAEAEKIAGGRAGGGDTRLGCQSYIDTCAGARELSGGCLTAK